MIKRLLIILLILAPVIAASQNYRPLPDSSAHWQLYRYVSSAPGNWYIEYSYYQTDSLASDTLISGEQYSKLFIHTSSTPFTAYAGCYRTDTTGKTWWINAQDTLPSLLVDIAVQQGDTVFNVFGYDITGSQTYYTLVVDTVKPYVAWNTTLKSIYLRSISPFGGYRFLWIESVGSANSFLNRIGTGLPSTDSWLICAGNNDTTWFYRDEMYISPWFGDIFDTLPAISGPCSLNASVFVGVDVVETDYFRTYPNPATTNFIVEPGSGTPSTLRIYTLAGQLLYGQRIQGRSEIEVSDLPGGIYLLELETPDGVARQKLVLQR
ncbi:MAG: T9SS type A sorting domain-containing protein [Bacteroidetes bacterium]|nr:T9SS type A sorting domain-containing protein [Bacteroidota bacterium]